MNYMKEVAHMLGVEIGETFYIQGLDGGAERFKAMLTESGLALIDLSVVNNGEATYLAELLKGNLEYEKLPWTPDFNELYYYPDVIIREVDRTFNMEDTYDFALIALGMAYRTREEAEAHFAEDFEQLTGKKLEVDNG